MRRNKPARCTAIMAFAASSKDIRERSRSLLVGLGSHRSCATRCRFANRHACLKRVTSVVSPHQTAARPFPLCPVSENPKPLLPTGSGDIKIDRHFLVRELSLDKRDRSLKNQEQDERVEQYVDYLLAVALDPAVQRGGWLVAQMRLLLLRNLRSRSAEKAHDPCGLRLAAGRPRK